MKLVELDEFIRKINEIGLESEKDAEIMSEVAQGLKVYATTRIGVPLLYIEPRDERARLEPIRVGDDLAYDRLKITSNGTLTYVNDRTKVKTQKLFKFSHTIEDKDGNRYITCIPAYIYQEQDVKKLSKKEAKTRLIKLLDKVQQEGNNIDY